MYSSMSDGGLLRRVSPFGRLRVTACLRLSVAYRSLPRPSSAIGAIGIHPMLLFALFLCDLTDIIG